MGTAAFAYVLVLRGAEAKNELMALLPEDRCADVQGVVEEIKDLPPEQLRIRLRNLRGDQLKLQREKVKKQIGLHADHVSPKLYAWLARPF